MTDRVFIRHPDHPERNGYVTPAAYDALWVKKGYVIEDGDDSALRSAVEGAYSEADYVDADRVAAATPTVDELNAQLDEKAELRAELERLGIGYDGRSGLKTLRAQVEAARAVKAAE